MKQMDQKEDVTVLRQAGFSTFEVNRLCQLKQTRVGHPLDQATIDVKHLQFIHWLVVHGRLSDFIS